MILATPYYPEHWPRERWQVDAGLMRDAGITRVRMAEFAWHRMEPHEGQFDFEWLREAIDLLAEHGIQTILCTPTPTYPAWLHRECPDVHIVKSDGRVAEYGQRQDACKNHPFYRERARRVVDELLGALGEHPAVVAWQTDNEFGCHGTARCWCDYCEAAFQRWLERRFGGDIDALNAAWGTSFWSHTYNEFDEVVLPRDTADGTGNDGQNPGLVLDFYRFSSDTQVLFQREQVDAIRRMSPGRPVTHNFMGLHHTIDYYDLAEDLDIVSWDNYPFNTNGSNRPPAPLPFDVMRGLKRENVWVMEQASGPGGWGRFAATPQPGQMRAWAWQTVARGADMVSFFRWRTCRWGREQYWHGILVHHGRPQRRYEEVKQLGGEFRQVADALAGTSVRADVGILYDYDSLWALETQPNAGGFDYRGMCGAWDSALARVGVTADTVGPERPFDRYRLLIAPTVHVCTPELAERLRAYVEAGGVLVMGPRSGVKDAENAVVNELLPGPLRELAGCHVEEYDAFSAVRGLEMTVRDESGRTFGAQGIADVLVPEGGEAFMFYGAHYYAGRPAAVRNRVGEGQCLYLGTVVRESDLPVLLADLLDEVGVEALDGLPDAVEFTRRTGEDGAFAFYVNCSSESVTTPTASPGTDLLTGEAVGDTLELGPFAVAIVQE